MGCMQVRRKRNSFSKNTKNT
uniref:Uncharacterized protein n=1 Tax=Anguilla anguilla TaxID=7936 RepID=A0A0E9VWP3_ANGAN